MRPSLWILSLLGGSIGTGVVAETGLDEPFTSSFAKLVHAPCVALYHRNGRTGCGTEDQDVQVGPLKYLEEDDNVPDTNSPYVAVVEDWSLTQMIDVLKQAQGGGFLKGVLVLNSTASDGSSEKQTYYSPDSQAPRGYGTPSEALNYGYYSYAWNPKGTGLMEYDLFGLPIAYVMDSDVSDSLRQEAQSSSADSSIVAEFNYYMGPAEVNSQDCLAWKNAANNEWAPKCLPLAGTSVWATAGSPLYVNKNSKRENRGFVMLSAGMDSTSFFHDLTPGANAAASNILTVLMAAKLIGANVNDKTLDNLTYRIVFSLFQGDTYGFVGSRSFLRDVYYPGFECKADVVAAVAKDAENSLDQACLYPLRHSLEFAKLGQLQGMLAVDQVGHMLGEGVLYVHADNNNDQYGAFMANTLKYCSTDDISVASATEANNGMSYPPSPLTSLLSISQGAMGGAILTGYDYAFTNKVPYHSIRDSANVFNVDLKSIAASATISARAILAAAYDGGNGDYENSAYYAKNLIPELSYDDETLVALADCFLYNGQCDIMKEYSSMETSNERFRTGLNLGSGDQFPETPNYYVGVYNSYYGQPFVQVGDRIFGAYDGDDYGKANTDAVGIMPRQLERTIHGLFNDFLGRGSNMKDGGEIQSCKRASDCADVAYCLAYGDKSVCNGSGECVCARAHYHVALDEALLAAPQKPTGYFEINENDQGISALYTEPFWSPSVGVRVYRDVGYLPGFLTLAAGLAVSGLSLFGAFVLKVGLKKEKLY